MARFLFSGSIEWDTCICYYNDECLVWSTERKCLIYNPGWETLKIILQTQSGSELRKITLGVLSGYELHV